MAQLGTAFDSKKHDDMNDFDPIPAGEYLAHVSGSDVCDTKAKTGKYIKLEFTVLQGKYKGRKIWTNLNIINPNPVAVEIAQKELATLCRAIGKGVIQDTQELHGLPLLMKVRVKKDKKGIHPDQNVPTGYKSAGGVPSNLGSPDNQGKAPDFVEDQSADSGANNPTNMDTAEPPADSDIPWG